MNPSPDRFNQLRRLLALKRYEAPPPGYFKGFSTQVIARIEAGDMAVEINWWEGFLARFDTKPVLVCAYGLLVCGGLLFGLSFVQMMEGDIHLSTQPIATANWSAAALANVPAPRGQAVFTRMGDSAESSFGSADGTLPSPELPSLLFDGSGVKVDRINYIFGTPLDPASGSPKKRKMPKEW